MNSTYQCISHRYRKYSRYHTDMYMNLHCFHKWSAVHKHLAHQSIHSRRRITDHHPTNPACTGTLPIRILHSAHIDMEVKSYRELAEILFFNSATSHFLMAIFDD